MHKPIWLGPSVHVLNSVVVWLDLLMSHPRTFSRRSQHLSLGLVLGYVVWILVCSHFNGVFPYPFLNKLPWPQVRLHSHTLCLPAVKPAAAAALAQRLPGAARGALGHVTGKCSKCIQFQAGSSSCCKHFPISSCELQVPAANAGPILLCRLRVLLVDSLSCFAGVLRRSGWCSGPVLFCVPFGQASVRPAAPIAEPCAGCSQSPQSLPGRAGPALPMMCAHCASRTKIWWSFCS